MAGYAVTFTVVDQATKQIDAINRRITAMRAPLDRLSKQVTRFVDVSGLNKVAQGFEWIGKAAGNVFRMLSNIVPVMGAITGAASIAGMIKLVDTYAQWSHTLVQTADNIGITTQNLQQFQNATRLAGGNADDMTGSLKALHDNMADFNIGRGSAAETAQMMNYLGVSMKDANGHLRDAGDVMKELIPKIAALRDPADRARIANGLLGASGDKLVETFRQTHRSFTDWFTDAGRYKALTDEQIAANQRFVEAQGRLGVAFDTLGQQVTAILTRDFGPLLDRLAQFVERNTPAILKAIDDLSARFAAWLGGIKWEDIETGLKTVGDSLTTIGHAVEFLVGMQLGLWFVKAAAGVAQLTAAFGSMGAGVPGVLGAVGGAGLLGVLGGVLTLIGATYLLLQKGLPALFGDRPGGLARPNDQTPNTTRPGNQSGVGPHHGLEPSRPGGGGHGGGPRLPPGATPASYSPPGAAAAPPSNLNLPANNQARGGAITANLARDLNLTPEQAAGITGNLQAESGLRAVQEGHPISGRGGFGWAQWTGPRRVAFEKYAKDNNLDPKSDEANYGFLKKELQSPEYAGLIKQLGALKGPNVARDSAALFERLFERPAVSNAGVRGKYAEQFVRNLPPAAPPGAAPPAAPGAGYKTLTQEQLTGEKQTVPVAPPINGSVDVSITHKNAPPNSAVTATGSGSVNVAPVRVEHQDMASI
jgi:Phage tail lysozyme